MRYILYLFTMALLFVGGMMVGNIYLPERSQTLAAAVSVPPLSAENPALQDASRQLAERNLDALSQALKSCPVVVNEEKDRLINQIRLLLALQEFEIQKTRLEMEMAKNIETNRPTAQCVQASTDYNVARQHAEELANQLFPLPAPVPAEPSADNKPSGKTDAKTEPSKNTAPEETAKPAEPVKQAASDKTAKPSQPAAETAPSAEKPAAQTPVAAKEDAAPAKESNKKASPEKPEEAAVKK